MDKSVHLLQPIGDPSPARGDFGVVTQGQTVLVSQETYDACRRLNIKTAEALINVAEAFPSSVAATLGWTIHDVQQALARASQHLAGVVDEAYLKKSPRPRLAFGASPPLANKSRGPSSDEESSAE